VSALMGLMTLIFDLLTLKLVCKSLASEVGNLPSKFGHARPLGSQITRYVRDGLTDKITLNAPFLAGRRHHK